MIQLWIEKIPIELYKYSHVYRFSYPVQGLKIFPSLNVTYILNTFFNPSSYLIYKQFSSLHAKIWSSNVFVTRGDNTGHRSRHILQHQTIHCNIVWLFFIIVPIYLMCLGYHAFLSEYKISIWSLNHSSVKEQSWVHPHREIRFQTTGFQISFTGNNY